MEKLQLKDLTPELMKEIAECGDPAGIVELLKGKNFEISEKGAEKILEQISKADSLNVEELEKIAGGWWAYGGTES